MSATPTLSFPNLELVSTLRVAPLNGPPNSEDYNDGEQEKLVDLTTLLDFLNDQLMPMLNALAPAAASGIEGTNIFGDSTSEEVPFTTPRLRLRCRSLTACASSMGWHRPFRHS